MVAKTKSENLFEVFLSRHHIPFESIPAAGSRTPDYIVTCADTRIVFEVKEIAEDNNFRAEPFTVSSRIVGDHIRSKIAKSKKQVQWGAAQHLASVLLIYNSLDTGLQLFGTEDHDFLGAMYGEYTLRIDKVGGGKCISFHGRNHALAADKNTSFSALGRLSDRGGNIEVTLFENAFAQLPLPYDQLPLCWSVVRVQPEFVSV